MKNFKTLLSITFIATALFLTSCSKDDDTVPISVQDLVVTIDENPTNGQAVGTVQTEGTGVASGFSITSQTPAGALSIDSNTGELTVADATLFDFETNPVITATISVVDAVNTGTVTVNLTNATELAVQDLTINFDENPTNGQSVDTVTTTNGSGTLSFSITSQTPAGALSVDSNTGELTVVDATLFDFETNPIVTATISVTDAINTATGTVTINLNDLVEVQDLTIDFDENPTNGQVVDTVSNNGGGVFSITSQTPAGALSINSSTGELTVADATLFDFETNPVITAAISAVGTLNTATATVTIDLIDLHEIGEFKFGGVIFWVNAANNEGYVVSINNLGTTSSIQWNDGPNTDTGAIATAIGTGQANTTAIVSSQGAGTYAAQVCDDLSLNGFSDWFLPSQNELNEVYINKAIINATSTVNGGTNFDIHWYWTSTQQDGNLNNAYYQFFGSGTQALNLKANSARVRAVRAWTTF
ncbi:MAG: cadherin domain-containing protein [Flavobacteriaceae bacterium]|nr:cadherin domain-containing protein [Flavobacteriaceae bacterium]